MTDKVCTVTVKIPSQFGCERIPILVASYIAQTIELPQEQMDGLEVCITEACINAFEHGYDCREDCEVVVIITVRDSALTVEVRDFGRGGFTVDTASKIQPGCRGWGLKLIQTYTDDVIVESPAGRGTRVIMTIYRDHKGDRDVGSTVV